jgi:inosine-uridine nucleoside N-ribohydrolase
MNHLILFCDYGLDDAAATVTVLRHQERFDGIDIVPIGGNVPVGVSHRNCLTLLSQFPHLLTKIRVVDTRGVPQSEEYLADIHGGDGMGDLFAPGTADVTMVDYQSWLEGLSGEERVLSLGPMTLVRPLMEGHNHPLVVMGGCIHTPPNFGEYEFNHALDKEAFAFCAPKAEGVITLDTCRVAPLNVRNWDLDDTLYGKILQRDVQLSYTRGEDGCYAWDDVAAQFVLFPHRFTVKEETDPHGNTYRHATYVGEKK